MTGLAVFCSGSGTNLAAIIRAVRRRQIPSAIRLVVSDRAEAYALVRARRAGIPTLSLPPHDFSSQASYERALIRALERARVRYIALAGFMRILSPAFVRRYRWRILNIHPALLPAFPGAHAVRDALAACARVTGVTVHLVDEGVDTGPIVLQETVRVLPRDTEAKLLARLHRVEHRLYPRALRELVEGRLRVDRGRVKFAAQSRR